MERLQSRRHGFDARTANSSWYNITEKNVDVICFNFQSILNILKFKLIYLPWQKKKIVQEVWNFNKYFLRVHFYNYALQFYKLSKRELKIK